MLTQEKIIQFNQILASNGTPAPEDAADFEIYKAMLNSQAMATASAQPQQTNPNFANPNVAATVPATTLAPVSNPVAVPVAQAAPIPTAVPSNGSHFTMDDMMSNSMTVDKYLKVKYQQMFIGDDVIGADHIFVRINLDNVVYKLSIKGGQPVSYASTLDGKTATTGGSWMEAVADIQKKDPKARPYNCADIPMVVAKEIKSPVGMTLADEGTILGHTTSTTNWKEWVSFYQALPEKTGEVLVKIGRKDVTKNKQQWGLITFSLANESELAGL